MKNRIKGRSYEEKGILRHTSPKEWARGVTVGNAWNGTSSETAPIDRLEVLAAKRFELDQQLDVMSHVFKHADREKRSITADQITGKLTRRLKEIKAEMKPLGMAYKSTKAACEQESKDDTLNG